MVTEYGIKYAVHILTNHFGDLPPKVCECLLRKGPLTRQSIKRFTELSDAQVENSLLVLIQFNCVHAFIPKELDTMRNAAKANTHYIALFNNIIHRVRSSKFLKIVSEKFDKQCVELFEGLLEHGRLSLKQMHERACEKGGNAVEWDSVRKTLLQLVTAGYVERCPAPEPVITPETEEQTRARKRKSAKITEETLEQRVMAAAAPSELIRFSVTTNSEFDVDGDKERNSSSTFVGEKRKHEALDTMELGFADEQTVAYRANFEEFVHQLRHKACVDTVRARLDDVAATVVSSMIEASRNGEKKVKPKNSDSLSLSDIYEEVIKIEAGRNITLDHVRASLVQLGNPPLVEAIGDSYVVDYEKIIELAQIDEVESVVLKRYGKDAYRMFRLLSKVGRLVETNKVSRLGNALGYYNLDNLETITMFSIREPCTVLTVNALDITTLIADSILVEKKDTPKILYKLWKDGYLHMEKLVVNLPRQNQFLLWKVNKQPLWEHVLNEMFHAVLNLSLRLAHELDREKELLILPADKRIGPLGNRFIRLREVRLLLECSQVKLDDAIMLFHDF